MDTKKERQKIFKDLVNKVGVKEVSHELGVSKQLVYLWLNSSDDIPESRQGPVDRLDKIISLALVKGYFQETVDLLNFFCKKIWGHYSPDESVLSELIGNLKDLKRDKSNGK